MRAGVAGFRRKASQRRWLYLLSVLMLFSLLQCVLAAENAVSHGLELREAEREWRIQGTGREWQFSERQLQMADQEWRLLGRRFQGTDRGWRLSGQLLRGEPEDCRVENRQQLLSAGDRGGPEANAGAPRRLRALFDLFLTSILAISFRKIYLRRCEKWKPPLREGTIRYIQCADGL